MRTSLAIAVFCVLFAIPGLTAESWPGTVSRYKGYERYAFNIAERPCWVTAPKETAPGRPWVWRARFPGFHDETDLILLERGFHIAFIDTNGMLGSPRAMKIWDAFHRTLTETHGLAKRPALEGVSRGGLFVYGWAARNPEKVACIYADTPVCDFKSWPLGQGSGLGHPETWQGLLREYGFTHEQALAYARNPIDSLEPMAKAGIPLLAIVSLNDVVVPPKENTFVLAERYRKLGGRIDIIEVEAGTPESNGHHFTHPDPLRAADFIERYASAAPDPEDYFALRGELNNCRIRFEREEQGRVAFLGGSITFGGAWRSMTCDYLRSRFPDTEFDFINAGIPSMGSTPGAFRLKRDVFAKGRVDLLFVEAAVNDSTNGRSPREMSRGMEGILRQARRTNPDLDIVVMHFVDPDKMAAYRAGETPVVIQRHERVAAHYIIPTIRFAREVTDRIDAGQFTWEADFKDLHPSAFGHRLYASPIRRMLSAAWAIPLHGNDQIRPRSMPTTLDAFNYDRAELVDLGEATALEGFRIIADCDPHKAAGGGVRDGFHHVPMLVGDQPGQSFRFRFHGRAVGLWVAAGPDAGVIEFRIDGGTWRTQELFTEWSAGLHLPWAYILAAELDGKEHTLRVRITDERAPKSKGNVCRIVSFLVNR